jgi:hypothetical protein
VVGWNGVVGGSRWERGTNSMETVSMENCGGGLGVVWCCGGMAEEAWSGVVR